MFEAVIAIGHGGIFRTIVVEFGKTVQQRFEFLLHRPQVFEDRHALGEYGSSRKREPVLWKIASGGALGHDERTVVEGVDPGQHFHQRGLAGAVRAHQSDAITWRDEPIGIFEEKLMAETFSGARELNHGLDLSSHKKARP